MQDLPNNNASTDEPIRLSEKALQAARSTLNIESNAILALQSRLDSSFQTAVTWIAECKGRVVICGMGKSGIIGRKLAATLASTGTPSLWMHSAEAAHGDLGQVTRDDILILISNSGETEETRRLAPLAKKIGARLIAMTGGLKSTLAKASDLVLDISVEKEGCPLGVAPMASTAAQLAYGDAMAACLIVERGFKKEDFAFFHPGGSLGRRLLSTVEDLMRPVGDFATANENWTVKETLLAITRARCGSACIVDEDEKLVGLFTDGDLRRRIENDPQILTRKVRDVMTANPLKISPKELAVEALGALRSKSVDELPVVNEEGNLVGLLDIQDLLKAGLM